MKKIQIRDIMFFVVLIVLVAITAISSLKKNDYEKTIAVHVKGEVRSPGYYELDYGKRVNDAIEMAGGLTDDADEDAINLAMVLRDGEEVIIPIAEKTKKTEKQ